MLVHRRRRSDIGRERGAAWVAEQMGHYGQVDTLIAHYRHIVSRLTAEEWWSIIPSTIRQRIPQVVELQQVK